MHGQARGRAVTAVPVDNGNGTPKRTAASPPLVLAADIGGTRTRAALVDGLGNVLVERSVATPAHDEAPARLIELMHAVGAAAESGRARRAVVGLPGAVDYEAGKLLWAPHLPATWIEQLSSERLSQRLCLPVQVANDADLAAVGEAAFGAGTGISDVAYLTISTGIGAGVVQRGRLLRGRRSLAEVGHTVIDWPAWCAGLPSTLEELGSGSGLARQARDIGLGDLDARAIGAAASLGGDARACRIWNRAIAACAAGVSNLVMAFYPSIVVIGGGLGRQPEFFAAVRSTVMDHAAHHPSDLAIVTSKLGDDAGLAGAAGWASATSARG